MCYVRLSPRQARAGVLFLLLTGGGPLLVPGFKELYLALKAEGMVLTLNTNGTLLDEQWADFFARHKPRRVNITLYGADDAAYETLCRCPGGFKKALAAVRLLRARGVDVKLNGSVTPENVGEMDRLYAIARQLDVPMHMDAYMMPSGAGATALTERTAGTARLPWVRWAVGIRTAGSSGSDRMREAAEGRSTPHFLWQKCCPSLAGAGRAC